MDQTDRRILRVLQRDATISMDALSEQVALSRNACWRRIKHMEAEGIIRGRVAIVDPEAVGLGLSVFIMVKAGTHSPEWLAQFEAAAKSMPEIIGAHRMTGDLDYILRVRVAGMKDYDRFYRRLIERAPASDISASFVMEDLRNETALPV